MYFNPKQIREGNRIKREAAESPTTFSTEAGGTFSEPAGGKGKRNQTRMAGPGGAFAMAIEQDPELAQKVAEFSMQFLETNPGFEFYKAKQQQQMMAAQNAAESTKAVQEPQTQSEEGVI